MSLNLNFSYYNTLGTITGYNPKRNKGTLIPVPIVDKEDPKEWGCTVENSTEKNVTFFVNAAADAPVGAYKVKVEFLQKLEDGKWALQTKRHILTHRVTILFNPWCEGTCLLFSTIIIKI